MVKAPWKLWESAVALGLLVCASWLKVLGCCLFVSFFLSELLLPWLLVVPRSPVRSVTWSVGRLVRWLIDWLMVWLIHLVICYFMCWFRLLVGASPMTLSQEPLFFGFDQPNTVAH